MFQPIPFFDSYAQHYKARRPFLQTLVCVFLFMFGGGQALADDTPPQLTLAVLGDSLTAGYGLPENAAFPAQLEQALKAKGWTVRVLNAGVSGDTTAGGLARLDWMLGDKPDAVIVELGANDALRGLDPRGVDANLDAILERLKQEGLPVLLAGMGAPRNYGPDYVAAFDPLYPRLAKKHGVLLYPFFLEGVATNPALNQQDGLHPTAEGVAAIVTRILPLVEDLLKQAQQKGAKSP